MDILLLLVFVAAIAFAAYRLSLLSFSGGVAAFLCGAAISLGNGWKGLVLLGVFFGSSSLLSKVKRSRKEQIESRHEKGSKRDWVQVAANGGIPAVIAIFMVFVDAQWLLIGFCIALASANADTWASELGVLSRSRPISVRSLRAVEPGTSGAVSLTGTLAAAAGSLAVAFAAVYLYGLDASAFFIVLLFGFAGMLIDTVIGAFYQALYKCGVCGAEVEAKRHCGKQTLLLRGQDKIRNDAVNFISCLAAAILGICFYVWI